MKIKKDGTTMVRLNEMDKAVLDYNLARINKERENLYKKPLSRGDLITLAIENLTIEQGVSK